MTLGCFVILPSVSIVTIANRTSFKKGSFSHDGTQVYIQSAILSENDKSMNISMIEKLFTVIFAEQLTGIFILKNIIGIESGTPKLYGKIKLKI